MIEELQIDVSSAELKDMLVARLKYHEDRRKASEAQLVEYDRFQIGLDEEARRIGKGSNATTPRDSLEQAVKKHGNQSIYYRFMSEHVVASETYRLKEEDLLRLGVAERFYG